MQSPRRSSAALAALVLLALVLGATPSQARPHPRGDPQVTYDAQSGTHVEQAHPSTNYCSSSTETVSNSTTTGKRAYNAFTTSVPAGNVITAATLKYWSQQTSATNVDAYLQTTWTGFPSGCSLTWNNKPAQGTLAGSSTGGQRKNAYTSVPLGTSGIPLAGTIGFMLNSQGTTDLKFDTDCGTCHKPQLVITYVPAAQAPTVVTGSASSVTATSATLNGTVNPNGQATTYHFEWGTSTSYGTSVPVPDGSAGSGTTAVAESANIAGLTPGQTYHFRLVATNATGTTNGADAQFTASSSTCAGTTVSQGADLETAMNAQPAGTTFCLQGGALPFRLTTQGGIQPQTGDVLQGVGADAVVTGAKVLGSWTASGSDWFATGFMGSVSTAGQCRSDHPLCKQQNDVFYDGTWLTPVASQASLAAGKAYLDYPNNRVYIRDNPSGHTVEQSWASKIFTGSDQNVQLKNITVTHAASPAQTGAIDPSSGGTGWVIDNVRSAWNHGYGIGPGADTGFTVTDSLFDHNGQIGTGGDGPNVSFVGNEISWNNQAGYDQSWEAGNKFGHAVDLVFTGNYSHDNFGPGFWCDINCQRGTVGGNYMSHNAPIGIFYEVSCGDVASPALIQNNTVVGNSEAQIKTAGSENVEISGNATYTDLSYTSPWTGAVLTEQRAVWTMEQHRTDSLGACDSVQHDTVNLYVHDNAEELTPQTLSFGGDTGLWTDTSDGTLYQSGHNNRYLANDYHYSGTPGAVFDWGISGQYTTQVTFSSWQAAGNDTTASGGSLSNDDPTPPSPPSLVVGPQP